ncbi:hypothetical protein SNE40_006112 [Patella caerulea]|uniref:CCHC-type domain-containing protein n=1 Tax=Patella caerulea TaxID=87958 RepID=A0AAN8K8X7_PATCE
MDSPVPPTPIIGNNKQKLHSTDDVSDLFNLKRKITKAWPRFLLIESPSTDLSKVSPFLIDKGIAGLAGEPKAIKKLKNGTLLIECAKEQHATMLLQSTSLADIPIKVSPHRSLNSSRGVIRCRDLEGSSEDEMVEYLSPQGVSHVKRISIRRGDKVIPTSTYILTFNRPDIPKTLKAGYLNIPVDSYISNPLRCYKCQKFGHSKTVCRGKDTCARCGHESTTCQAEFCCVNCKGKHFAYSRECPIWQKEKRIQQIMSERKISYFDARKQVELTSLFPIAPQGKSFSSVVKASTKSASVQTDITWPDQVEKPRNITSDHCKGVSSPSQSRECSTQSTDIIPNDEGSSPLPVSGVIEIIPNTHTQNSKGAQPFVCSKADTVDSRSSGSAVQFKGTQLSTVLTKRQQKFLKLKERGKKGSNNPITLFNKYGDDLMDGTTVVDVHKDSHGKPPKIKFP